MRDRIFLHRMEENLGEKIGKEEEVRNSVDFYPVPYHPQSD